MLLCLSILFMFLFSGNRPVWIAVLVPVASAGSKLISEEKTVYIRIVNY